MWLDGVLGVAVWILGCGWMDFRVLYYRSVFGYGWMDFWVWLDRFWRVAGWIFGCGWMDFRVWLDGFLVVAGWVFGCGCSDTGKIVW